MIFAQGLEAWYVDDDAFLEESSMVDWRLALVVFEARPLIVGEGMDVGAAAAPLWE